jgi:hypothetical protein
LRTTPARPRGVLTQHTPCARSTVSRNTLRGAVPDTFASLTRLQTLCVRAAALRRARARARACSDDAPS